MKHPRAWNRNHWILLLGALTMVATWLWYTRPVPLSEALEIDQATTPVEVWLMRQTMVENTGPGGGYRYLVTDTELTGSMDSEGVRALSAAMAEITCRRQVRLPFWDVHLYVTGKDQLSFSFRTEDRRVETVWMNRYYGRLYDIGEAPTRAYRVDDADFEQLAAVVEQYGTVQE